MSDKYHKIVLSFFATKMLKFFLIGIVLWTLTLQWTTNRSTQPKDNYSQILKRGADYSSWNENKWNNGLTQANNTELKNIKLVRIAIVSCGQDRMGQTINLVKSAIISALRFNLESLELIVFTDDLLPIDIKLNEYRNQIPISLNFLYEIRPTILPPEEDAKEWMGLFRPCASQRLFFPEALPDIDELIYLDTDILILEDLREIWSYFSKMNESQHTGLVSTRERNVSGHYGPMTPHPYYHPSGVNSGVMLMNLTRIRGFDWNEKVIKYYKEYKNVLTLGDQDIINIIFHYHPESLYILPCVFNYGYAHCPKKGQGGCPSAEMANSSVRLLHGYGQSFKESSKELGFRVIYAFFEKLTLSTKTDFATNNLFTSLKRDLSILASSGNGDCDKIGQVVF